MPTVFDVAEYVLKKHGPMTTMKLQKLVYYCQAWSLVWDEAPIFDEPIEAWANGPVVRELFERHRGQFEVATVEGDCKKLTKAQRETVQGVLQHYGNKSSQWLSDLTHLEQPWKDARANIPESVRGKSCISHGAMADYYGNL